MKLYDIWLDRISGISPRGKHHLVEKYGDSKIIYEAGAEKICFDVTGQSIAQNPKGNAWRAMFQEDLSAAQEQLRYMEKKEIKAVSIQDLEYPPALRLIHDPPWMLYYLGSLECLKNLGVAVVGARNSTEYGRWVAYELARKLSGVGICVVSGMACGIDAAAHRGALSGAKGRSGSTVAVLGCGVDICYPRANNRLMEQIIEGGAVVSELAPGTKPRPYFFPRRNRIISGLSSGVVVTEAGIQSGSLITAELAADQGRDVFAVPGNINRTASIGTNQLIRDGAIPIVVLDDLLTALHLPPTKFTESTHIQLGVDEQKVYNMVIQYGELSADQLASKLGISVGNVNALVTVLEMKGILHTALGKIFIAKL